MNWDRKWLIFNAKRTQLVLLDCSNKSVSADIKMFGSLVNEKIFFMIKDFF